jgi:hypothetical protein
VNDKCIISLVKKVCNLCVASPLDSTVPVPALCYFDVEIGKWKLPVAVLFLKNTYTTYTGINFYRLQNVKSLKFFVPLGAFFPLESKEIFLCGIFSCFIIIVGLSVVDPENFDADLDPDPSFEKTWIQIPYLAAYTHRRYVVFAFCPK